MRFKGLVCSLTLILFCGASAQRPNIIYIMTDDLGYADLSCYGRKDYKTPHIDELATEGVRFISAYAAAPVCTPTRAAFLTGRYPARNPVGLREPLDWTAEDSAIGLKPDQNSIAALLKRNGYETCLIGKWHLGFAPEYSPNRNGFNEFYGFHGGAIDYVSHTDPMGNNDLYENERQVKASGYLTDVLTEKALDFIRREHNSPFFLCLFYSSPHWPWQAPGDTAYALGDANWKKGGSAGTYAAMMKNLDESIGAITKALEEQQLSNNTLLVFTSDNGGERYSDMGKYRGRKLVLQEGGIRVPAIARWPGIIPAGTVSEQAVITMDWSATFLAVSQTRINPREPLDGINIIPFVSGEKRPVARTFYWRVSQRNQQQAIRDGYWKYLRDEKGEYLFDLFYDPGEKRDQQQREPEIFNTLKNKFTDWEKSVLPPLPPLH